MGRGVGIVLLGIWVLGVGCGGDLPEPESRGAKLYEKNCSGKGCHAPISPRRGGKRYWDAQYERMKPMMRQQGGALPSVEEEREILTYLHRHAQSSKGKE